MNSTNVFTVDKANKTLICEASDLDGFYAIPGQTITVKSAKTGKMAAFEVNTASKDAEGDVTSWDLRPTHATKVVCPELAGWKVVVFND